MFANSPVEMLAHMLQVAEGWPTKSRLIGGDRENLNNLKALLGNWLSLSFWHSSDSVARDVQQISQLAFTCPQLPSLLGVSILELSLAKVLLFSYHLSSCGSNGNNYLFRDFLLDCRTMM